MMTHSRPRLVLLAAVVASLLQAPGSLAATDPEPDCRDKGQGIQGFHAFTDPATGGVIADLYVGEALCGTDIFPGLGLLEGAYFKTSFLTPGDMDSKIGPAVRCAKPIREPRQRALCEGTDLPRGAYVGSGSVAILYCYALAYGCVGRAETRVEIRVYDAGTKAGPVRNRRCKDVSAAVQCFQARAYVTDPLGRQHDVAVMDIVTQACWAVEGCRQARAPEVPNVDPMRDRYVLTFYKPEPLVERGRFPLEHDLYYLKIGTPDYAHEGAEPDPGDLHLCGRANPTGMAACGTDDADWVLKNPPAGGYGCVRGRPEGYGSRAEPLGNLIGIPDECYPAAGGRAGLSR